MVVHQASAATALSIHNFFIDHRQYSHIPETFEMALESLLDYLDLLMILLVIILTMIAWLFRSKANAMEKYVAANRATREFMDSVMISLEDLAVTDEEAEEIKSRCMVMVTAISEFVAALDDDADPEVALTESVQKMTG